MSLLRTQSTHNVVCDATAKEVIIHLYTDEKWHTYQHEGRAQNVLSFLNQDLEQHNLAFEDISEIGVVMEGPSFTATRVMTVIANTCGFIAHKKVRAIPPQFTESDDKTKIWNAVEQKEFLIPTYNAPPNITLKKK